MSWRGSSSDRGSFPALSLNVCGVATDWERRVLSVGEMCLPVKWSTRFALPHEDTGKVETLTFHLRCFSAWEMERTKT